MTEEHYEYVIGPPAWVQQQVDRRWRSGRLRGMTRPKLHEEGVQVRLRLAGPAPVETARQAQVPDTVWPRLTLREQQPVAVRDWTPVVRPVLIGGGAVALLFGVVWLVVQAVQGVAAAAAANLPLLIFVGLWLAVAGALWLRWRWNRWRAGKGCPGVRVHHCARCPDH